MKILAARVRWNESWGNTPDMEVLVDNMPDESSMVFEEKAGLYLAIQNGYASYMYYNEPGDGYGGRVFTVKMQDGSIRRLTGPWSSRAGCVNAGGFDTQIMDVSMTDNAETFNSRGMKGCFIAGAITLDLAVSAAKMARCTLAQIIGNEPAWHPSKDPRTVVKPHSKFGCKKRSGYSVYVENRSFEVPTLRDVSVALTSC